jgi:Protein of unknown function (DUF3224)
VSASSITTAGELTRENTSMQHHVKGTFDVKVTPQDPKDSKPPIAHLAFEKQFHGAIEAGSKGEMLASGGPETGSGGYVAIEVISGTLDGRRGTFALQHLGRMDPSGMSITVVVVPGSGTGELAGLSGTMQIIIEGGKHFYEFEYELGRT